MEPRSGVTLHLDRLEDLFSAPSFGEFGASADLQSGIERLVAELKATPGAGAQVTVVIPDTPQDPGVQERLSVAIRSYAAQRIGHLQHQRAALRREGRAALLLCGPAVVALALLSISVEHSSINQDWRTVIDDLILVLFWVALWYPLDALLWYGRPLSQELRVLRRLEAATVTVRRVT